MTSQTPQKPPKPDQRAEKAIDLVLRHEGGYVCDPRDPGGCTNYGISQKAYPHLDIKRLTKIDARRIYLEDWWKRRGFWRIHSEPLALKAFDIAVNVGTARAVRWLQAAAKRLSGRNILEDGALGLESEAAINSVDPARLLIDFLQAAYRHYDEVATRMPQYRKGWMARLLDM